MQSTSEMTPTETLIENAERQRRWLRRVCWAGFALALAAILLAVGYPLFVRWQLRQHGWILDSVMTRHGYSAWIPNWADPWIGQIESARLEQKPLRITDLDRLRRFPNLETIWLESTDVSEPAFESLSKLSQVHWVGILSARFETAGLHYLAMLPKLEGLAFTGVALDDGAFETLATCPRLQFLTLNRTTVADESLRHLSRLGQLTYLELDQCDLGDRGLAHVANCGNLNVLVLKSPLITDIGLSSLSRLTHLTNLNLHNSTVTDAGAKVLADGCPKMQSLWIFGALMTDAVMLELARLPDLRTLYLHDMPISDEGILRFKTCPLLQTINVKNTKVTSAGVTELRKSLPTLEVSIE